MSLKKIEQIKEGKWFRVWDIIVYAVILVTVTALILAFTLGRDKSSLQGFYISYGGERVLTYEFGAKSPEVLKEDNIEVTERDGGFTVRFVTDDGKGYNVIDVDTGKLTVSITESNCSTHKDCVYTPALKYNSSAPIICTPHALSIGPLVFEDNGVIG